MSTTATPENIAHLYRRVALGGTGDQIAAAATAGISETVERLLDFSASPQDSQPPGLPRPRDQIDGKAEDKTDVLRRWWLDRLIASPTPALERLTLVWHGHFATSVEKVSSDVLMWRQNATLRRLAAGSFRDLLQAMSRDAALLLFLDAPDNTAEAPNENLAREVMELFALGRDAGYTQADVREAARAFTGWSVDDHDSGKGTYTFRFVEDDHDGGFKTLLGRTGRWDGSNAVAILLDHPECPRHVARRLWRRYAGGRPDDRVLADLVEALGPKLDVAALLRRMLTHSAFYEPPVTAGIVSSPVEFAVRALRAFNLSTHAFPSVVDWLDAMNQRPFAPPNVGGWPDGSYWTSSAASAARINFAHDLAGTVAEQAARGRRPDESLLRLVDTPDRLFADLVARLGITGLSPASDAAVRRYSSSSTDPASRLVAAITLMLATPEVQLL